MIKLTILRGGSNLILLEWTLNGITIYPFKRETVNVTQTQGGRPCEEGVEKDGSQAKER